jgi:hypothetical protein
MADKKKDKTITDILSESRNMLYGENVELTSVLINVLTLLGRMDTRLSYQWIKVELGPQPE